MRRKGFTLVELLVVISIIALLMAILMPALSMVKKIAYRMVCGTNLSGIGKSMLAYANDHDEQFPRAGGRNSKWTTTGAIPQWYQDTPQLVWGSSYGTSSGALTTITSSYYLLVKYTDLTPDQFVCKGDSSGVVFKLADYTNTGGLTIRDYQDVWDFGSAPGYHCSYSYQFPYQGPVTINGQSSRTSFVMNTSGTSINPVSGDRNPWLDKTNNAISQPATQIADPSWDPGTSSSAATLVDKGKKWNSNSHNRDGQNILYADAHVQFQKLSNCGANNDNVWKVWTQNADTATPMDKQFGGLNAGNPPQGPTTGSENVISKDRADASLINEWQKGLPGGPYQ